MQWWVRAAWALTLPGARLRRFGFVTTNSITQTFSRRVIEARLAGTPPIALVMAIADHPWTKATRDSAAVRIAMTVADAGSDDGQLIEVLQEAALDTDAPELLTATAKGRINADLTVGADVTSARPLRANTVMASPGVKLHGAGFIVTPADAVTLGLGSRPGLDQHIRSYRNGRDLMGNGRGAMVIDLFGLAEAEVRQRFPEVWQHLHATVKPERDANRRATYRDNWWIFGEPRRDLRPALSGLERYIVTVETAKHRVFQFLDASILPDNMLIAIASDDAFHVGVLSSHIHIRWSNGMGGTLEDRPRYTKSQIFDPFPFPNPTPDQRAAIADLAEELDATRKIVQAEHPDITLTGLYNLVEKLRAGAVLIAAEADTARRARASIILELHRRIDAAVAAAYGWPADLAAADIVARLVALNAARAAEEAAGTIRWLRPDYQAGRA
ncbi:type IIL restriction-modification enzyme MmeI [Sandarakinorhabdus sp.]|uniref:type IIL restriction-modification enzyme MmeI n=1 Tax=Sandarakinorhabdus sp. TaxID=1916663 RepID=UPI00356A54B3